MGFGLTPCRGTLFKTNMGAGWGEEKKIIRSRKPFISSSGYILKEEGGNVLFSPPERVTSLMSGRSHAITRLQRLKEKKNYGPISIKLTSV